jgi:hypothetical protein
MKMGFSPWKKKVLQEACRCTPMPCETGLLRTGLTVNNMIDHALARQE